MSNTSRCPVCSSQIFSFAFRRREFALYSCDGCGVVQEVPRAGAGERPQAAPVLSPFIVLLKEVAATGRVLAIGQESPNDAGAPTAPEGIEVSFASTLADLESPAFAGKAWPTVVVLFSLLTLADPGQALGRIRRCLAPDGELVFALPLLDTGPIKLPGPGWPEWRKENRWYFGRETLHLLLLRQGFDRVWFRRQGRAGRDGRVARAGLPTRVRNTFHRLAHQLGLSRPADVPSGSVFVTARAAPAREQLVVSIVVPAYNEQATFAELMDGLLAKELAGLRKEIIIVESNSTDGTRELALEYGKREGVRLLLQPGPRGKGYAVREGIAAATGDILMIQDADLEYDLDDYEALLRPLLQWRSMFVLGSRHSGDWKMRRFADAPLTAMLFNLGHLFFTSVLNLLLRQRMADPFTMYKVVRRDALHGLEFICKRFDFDHELVIKLVRKGYRPLEVPVNYNSRSFAEGKKVSIVRDGLPWIWTDIKLRLGPIGKRPH